MNGDAGEWFVHVVEVDDVGSPGEDGSERLFRAPPRRPWWPHAGVASRAVALVALLAVALASASATAAIQSGHHVRDVMRTVLRPGPPGTDATGCPVPATCAVREASSALRVLRADAPVADATGTEVYDGVSPGTVYQRHLHGTGVFDGARAAITVAASCALDGAAATTEPTAPSADDERPVTELSLTGSELVDSYTRRYGSCVVSVWCRYPATFTAGGYPSPSTRLADLARRVGSDPRIYL